MPLSPDRAAPGVAACCALLLCPMVPHQHARAVTPPAPGEDRARNGEGIWKAAVPSQPMKAEFGGLDPVGVAAGAKIQADCSLNWVDPDAGVRYCFASGTSLQYFLERPQAMIARARANWRRLQAR
jgi:hypothetical protein